MTIDYSILQPYTPTPTGWTATIVNSVMLQKIRQLPVGYTYTLDEDETITPDLVSQLFYDSPHYAWVVMVYNNFLDIRELSAKNKSHNTSGIELAKFSFLISNDSLKLYTKDILTKNTQIYKNTSCVDKNLYGFVNLLDGNYIEIISVNNTILYRGIYNNFQAIIQSSQTLEIRLPDKLHLMNLITSIVDQGD